VRGNVEQLETAQEKERTSQGRPWSTFLIRNP
jgi:hypothetical protein